MGSLSLSIVPWSMRMPTAQEFVRTERSQTDPESLICKVRIIVINSLRECIEMWWASQPGSKSGSLSHEWDMVTQSD